MCPGGLIVPAATAPEEIVVNGMSLSRRNSPYANSGIVVALETNDYKKILVITHLDELKDAIESNDIVAAADAFSDIQYVLSGAILEFGLGAKFADLFAEVQKSNMSKACKTYDEALASQAWYLENKNTESSIVEREGQYLLYRKSDLKVLKSINYYAADFDKILKS